MQIARRFPVGPDACRAVAIQRKKVRAPIVASCFGLQQAFVGLRVLCKWMATIKGMLLQHALAPAMNGMDRRFIHPLPGILQASSCTGTRFCVRIGGDQVGEKVVVRCSGRAERQCGVGQSRTDAFAQFRGCRLGEGQDQDLRRQQRFACGRAVAKYKAQIERGDGPGLAGAGTGLDQADAMQWHGQRLQGQRTHVAASSIKVSISGR